MGAYLSSPVIDKDSSDVSGARLLCGASSMQGWRQHQEDAHNCSLNFDDDASLFAVYDGHGGKEVAEYSALKLPDFIKQTDAYKSGNIEQALRDAFIQFDATLKTPQVQQILKEMAGRKDENCSETDEENLDNLKEEAQMPIEEVMAKITKQDVTPCPSDLKSRFLLRETKAPLSPLLRARCSSSKDGCSSSNEVSVAVKEVDPPSECNGIDEKPTSNGISDDCVGSSAEVEQEPKAEKVVCSSKTDEVVSSGESDGKVDPKLVLNGENTNNEEKIEVTSSQENGKGKGKKLMKKQPKTPPKEPQSADQLFEKFVYSDTAPSDSESESEDETFHGPASSSDDSEVAEAIEDEEEDSDEDESEDEDEGEDEDDPFTMGMTDDPGYDSGCTAVVALIKNNKIYVANAGDSRCIVSKNGEAVEMSFDHKPEDEPELSRIVKAGGKVTSDGRVNGGLNLSRALGDHGYKLVDNLPPEEQMISPLPDIKVLDITDDVEFVLLACDGIWNFMSSKEVLEFVRPRLKENRDKVSSICEELFDHCLAPNTLGDGTGCDNMTAVIVYFKDSIKTKSESEPSLKRSAEEYLDPTEDNKRHKTEEPISSSSSQSSMDYDKPQRTTSSLKDSENEAMPSTGEDEVSSTPEVTKDSQNEISSTFEVSEGPGSSSIDST